MKSQSQSYNELYTQYKVRLSVITKKNKVHFNYLSNLIEKGNKRQDYRFSESTGLLIGEGGFLF